MISIHPLLCECPTIWNVIISVMFLFVIYVCVRMEGAKGNGRKWVLVYLHQVLMHLTVITDSCITNHCFLMQSVHVRREKKPSMYQSLPLTKSSVLYSKLTCLVLQEWVDGLQCGRSLLIDCMINSFFCLFVDYVVYMYVWGHMHLSTARNLWLFALFCIHKFILATVLSLNEI